MQCGILSSVASPCHALEAPEIKNYTHPIIPQFTSESTMQTPYGEFSALSELRLGTLKPVDTLLLSVFNYRSNWDNGKTWKTSLRELSELTGISTRYIRDKLRDLISNQ